MAGMGPPPKDPASRVRRNATAAMTRLPASGRTGAAPRWPLQPDLVTKANLAVVRARAKELLRDIDGADAAKRAKLNKELGQVQQRVALLTEQVKARRAAEVALWKELWKTPQATQWELLGWTREVAMYVRLSVAGETGDMDATKEARQWSDRLGLTSLALLRLRWVIVDDRVPASVPDTTPTAGNVTRIDSRRARLTG
jgi:hypothetical protein